MPESNTASTTTNTRISSLHGWWYFCMYISVGILVSTGVFAQVWNTVFPFGPTNFEDNALSRLFGLVVCAVGSFGLPLRYNVPWLKCTIFSRGIMGGIGLPVQFLVFGGPYSYGVIWLLEVVPVAILWWDLYRNDYGHPWELARVPRSTPLPITSVQSFTSLK